MFEIAQGVIKYRGVGDEILELQRRGEELLRQIEPENAEKMIAARVARDGEGKAHVTVVGPRELSALNKSGRTPDITGWAAEPPKALGLGWASEDPASKAPLDGVRKAYFIPLKWDAGRRLREELGLSPDGQDFHLTIGFVGGDVHGVCKTHAKWSMAGRPIIHLSDGTLAGRHHRRVAALYQKLVARGRMPLTNLLYQLEVVTRLGTPWRRPLDERELRVLDALGAFESEL